MPIPHLYAVDGTDTDGWHYLGDAGEDAVVEQWPRWWAPTSWLTSTTTSSALTTTYRVPTYTYTSSSTVDIHNIHLYEAGMLTEGQEVGHAAWLARNRERETARTSAESKAERLLMSFLNADQQAQYRQDKSFDVMGSAGNVYRIRRGSAGNVDWIRPDGSVGGRFCAHPDMYTEGVLPLPDVAVAQMLALTTDERGFLRIANVHAGTRPIAA